MPTHLAAALEVEEVTTARALEALRPEWSQLRSRAGATPFQSPEWMLAWWRHLGHSPLWTLAVRHDGYLVGLAPFFVWTDPEGVRRLLLIGTGLSDRLDVLLDPAHRPETVEAIVAHLEEHQDHWDVCDLQQLSRDSTLLGELPGDVTGQDPCPVLALPDRIENLDEVVPAGQLKKLHYYRRRASKEGSLQVEQARESNLEEFFEALLSSHAARWSARDLPGVLADDGICTFHREAAVGLLERGALRLYALRLDEQIIASFYGFRDQRNTYYYLGGFNPRFKQLSPGLLIVGHAIEQAVREGCRTFDFLRGREAYKYDWGAVDEPSCRRIWHSERFRNNDERER